MTATLGALELGGATGRLAYLDNLKVVLVMAVIVAHAGMTYGAAGTWVFQVADYGGSKVSGALKGLLSAAIGLGVLFGMGLFLMMAALVTPPSLARREASAFTRGRLVRLGIPVAVYPVIVMPLLGLLIESTARRRTVPVWQFLGRRLRSPSTGPAWFIAGHCCIG